MTKKDYEEIAAAVSATHQAICTNNIQTIGCVALKLVALELADKLERDNPQFDRSKFVKTCEGR